MTLHASSIANLTQKYFSSTNTYIEPQCLISVNLYIVLPPVGTTLPCLHVQNGTPASVQNLLSSCEQVSTNPRPAFGEPKISLDCLTVSAE